MLNEVSVYQLNLVFLTTNSLHRNNETKTSCNILNKVGREPWSSGYERRLMS